MRSTTRIWRAVLQRPLLTRAQFPVDGDQVGGERRKHLQDLLELAPAQIGLVVGTLALLDDLGHRLGAGGAQQLDQFDERVLGVFVVAAHRGDDDGLLGPLVDQFAGGVVDARRRPR